MSEIADRYRRRAEEFARRVAAVPVERWDDPSPCAGWVARDVVGHVVGMHGYMLRPVGRQADGPSVHDDPVAAFEAARAAVVALLDDPDLAEVECETPGGRMSAAEQVDRVASDDLVVHGWDLARATGQDDAMHPDDVARLWAVTTAVPPEVMESYRTPGALGPGVEVYGREVPVDPTAPLQDRLLGFVGRDPAWRRPPTP